jgi:filamin
MRGCYLSPYYMQVACDGPSKVTLDCYEVDVGYKVRYTPFAPGDYFMTIKYNQCHIPGSPFKVAITGTLCYVGCNGICMAGERVLVQSNKHLFTGKGIGGSGENESSALDVVTTPKKADGTQQAPKLAGDASKVECNGAGLKKAFAGRHAAFNVDASKAGILCWMQRCRQ